MFTIGEFSRLSHVSSRMLRHYDAIGLLCPAHTGAENGYRYYDAAQLPILLQIENLKSYGFTLAQITVLLTLPREELVQRIHCWLSEHPEYQVSGPGIERYIKDEESVSDPEELETGVLFPVTKAE